jgi:hypothetical protein
MKTGVAGMKRGEIRWYRFRAPDKRRPVIILTRDWCWTIWVR